MSRAFDVAISVLPMAAIAAVTTLPWELWCAAGALVTLVFLGEEVRAHLAQGSWDWAGKRVAVVRCGAGSPTLPHGMRLVLEADKKARVVGELKKGGEAPMLDAAVLFAQRPNKASRGIAMDIGRWRQWTEATDRTVAEYFHPFDEMCAAVKLFVGERYDPRRPGLLVVVLDGAAELSGDAGAEAMMATWAALGLLEGLRAELRRSHPNLFLTTCLGELPTPTKTVHAVVDAAHAYHRAYLPPSAGLVRLLFLLPPPLQRWAAARLAAVGSGGSAA
eukprot:TRINITY_DN32486_c0_g1_i1.p1 TRINITY_DN32486_c0_g1~~TRINITY_DN32486_c0_g1_i1.p1  ORF type:complete len:276 (+),score=97.93 TRINITY_DN32486_c0_g1_i1:43-870(+)